MSTNRWMTNKFWYIHKMEYDSGTRRDELLRYTTKWMDFKITVWIRTARQKSIYSVLLFIWNSKKCKQSTMAKSRSMPENGQGVEGKKRRSQRASRKLLREMDVFAIWTVVVVTQVDTYVKTYQVVHYVQFIMYQLYPNKAVNKYTLNNESVILLEQLCHTSICCHLGTVGGKIILNLPDYLKYDLMVLIKVKCLRNKLITF